MGMGATLDCLQTGQTARILDIRGPETVKSRLLDLGFSPGSTITAVYKAAAGDPTAYRVQGAIIALRAANAALIQIIPEGEI